MYLSELLQQNCWYPKWVTDVYLMLQQVSEIVSIDIGFQNAAWVHIDEHKQVLGWSRAEILKPKPYNPAVFKPLVSSCKPYFFSPDISLYSVLIESTFNEQL